MNLITAFVIGFLVLFAFLLVTYVIYYVMESDNINNMKQNIWNDIKMLDFEDVFNYLAAWGVCSVMIWAVVNAGGLLISFFIAADVNLFELIFDAISYDPLAEPIKLTNLTLS